MNLILPTTPIYQQKDSDISSEIRRKANILFKETKKYNQEKYINIINEYSKSLTLAPKESDEYALALSNRSAVLIKIFKYENCLIDVDAALKISKDDVLTFKLLCRKIECLINLNQKNKIKEHYAEALKVATSIDEKFKDNMCLDKLSSVIKIEPRDILTESNKKDNNKFTRFISDAVSWSYNEKFGNHLIANRDINVGKKLIIEDFYCAFPDVDKLYIVCSNCLLITLNSIPCDSCPHAVFCSERCKDMALKKFHEIECDIYQNLFKYINLPLISRNIVLTVRFFLIALKEKGNLQSLIKKANEIDNLKVKNKTIFNDSIIRTERESMTFDFVYGLTRVNRNIIIKHKNTDSDEQLSTAITLTLLSSKHFLEEDIKKNINSLKKLFTNLRDIINANSFSITDPRYYNGIDELSLDFGIIVMPVTSLVNHSCKPNTAYTFSKNSKFILYAEKPIKKNEQIFISYEDGTRNIKERQELLLELYRFKCDCTACKENWQKKPLPTDKEILRLEHKNIYDFFKSISKDLTNYQNYFETNNLKESEPILCEIIKKGHQVLSEYDAELALEIFRNNLGALFRNLYSQDEIIPKENF